MRTTLTIDDSLAQAVEQFRQKRNMSIRESINHLLRIGLLAAEKKEAAKQYQGPVFDSHLQPGIDPNRMNQLADELEVECF